MGNGVRENFTRGPVRTLLFIDINQSFVTAHLLSCSQSLKILVGKQLTQFSFRHNNSFYAVEDSDENENSSYRMSNKRRFK